MNTPHANVPRNDGPAKTDFLSDLLRSHAPAIRRLVVSATGTTFASRFGLDEAQQSFLIAANAAIDSWRPEDDGRGKNSLERWCAWKGLRGVRDAIRDTLGRPGRADLKRAHVASMLSESDVVRQHSADAQWKDRTFSDVLAGFGHAHGDFANGAVSEADLRAWLATRPEEEREIALLFIDGQYRSKRLRCTCTDLQRHSLRRDLATCCGLSEVAIEKLLTNLRTATRHYLKETA